MKEKFIELLKSTNREGMDELLDFIEKTDFYTAPASTRFHGCYEKGLLEHSLKVYEILKEKVKHAPIEIETPEESLIIIALLHDICKANFYKSFNSLVHSSCNIFFSIFISVFNFLFFNKLIFVPQAPVFSSIVPI